MTPEPPDLPHVRVGRYRVYLDTCCAACVVVVVLVAVVVALWWGG